MHNCRISADCLVLAPDLQESLARADQFEANRLKAVDLFIEKASAAGKIPLPPLETVESLQDAYAAPQHFSLDLRQAGIQTIIWAMGYRYDISMVKFPVLDEAGFPVGQGGVTQTPGLFFCGMPWMDSLKSGLLLGIGESAELIAAHLQQS
jgi:putative flavoprotein involved in K+ transport